MSATFPLRFVRLALLVLFVPALAYAHPGHDGHELTWDFQSGFFHPFSGWDHLLAMLAVGLWAAQLGGRARWGLPAAFMAAMVCGASLARAGLAVPALEQGIAASVLVLGLLVGFAARLRLATSVTAVAAFAVFHGAAHGAEMPAAASALTYGAGFIAATALLSAAGLGLGVATPRFSTRATHYAGWAIAACGAVMLAA